jgi:DNA-binding MarR family transcriptional regulator
MDDRFPINAIQTFFYIAEHGPCLKHDMEIALGFSVASGSRNSDYLSSQNRFRKPGMGLITKEDYPEDRRNSVLHLTEKGLELLKAIAN